MTDIKYYKLAKDLFSEDDILSFDDENLNFGLCYIFTYITISIKESKYILETCDHNDWPYEIPIEFDSYKNLNQIVSDIVKSNIDDVDREEKHMDYPYEMLDPYGTYKIVQF